AGPPRTPGGAAKPGKAGRSFGKAKSCLLLYLSGGPAQLDTFDPKPDAPDDIRDGSIDGAELAADIVWSVRLGIKGIELCRAAGEVKDDALSGLPETTSAARTRRLRRRLLGCKQRRQRQPRHR